MKVQDLKKISAFNFINLADEKKDVSGVFIGDLLSWVMANGDEGQIWITVQAHLNVVAVSLLKEFSCLLICDGAQCDEDFVLKCQQEEVNLIQTSLNAYECAKALAGLSL